MDLARFYVYVGFVLLRDLDAFAVLLSNLSTNLLVGFKFLIRSLTFLVFLSLKLVLFPNSELIVLEFDLLCFLFVYKTVFSYLLGGCLALPTLVTLFSFLRLSLTCTFSPPFSIFFPLASGLFFGIFLMIFLLASFL